MGGFVPWYYPIFSTIIVASTATTFQISRGWDFWPKGIDLTKKLISATDSLIAFASNRSSKRTSSPVVIATAADVVVGLFTAFIAASIVTLFCSFFRFR